ncbi:MAG TPA: hypothetical protein VL403_05030, partial [Candidatus Kryptonia bacterium]|nr:hypothetical protein [Candidatus Kryptonia bacterium]
PLFHRDQHTGSMVSRPSRRAARARSHRSWLKAATRSAVILLRSSIRRRTPVLPAWLQASAPSSDCGSAAVAPLRRESTTLPALKRRTIAFGSVRDQPSWNWVGFDTARELSKHYDVGIYDSWSRVPDCDVLFVIKDRPPDRFIHEAQAKRTKLVYCPIDVYQGHDHLIRDADFLRACAMVVVHCERLKPLVQPYCGNTHFVDHHNRYALDVMVDYKSTGFLLWIGGCQYVPYLVRWLEHHPIDYEVKILTDIDNYRARHVGRINAAEIGMRFGVYRSTTSIAGCEVYRWSERRQAEMMRECKAALDIKMTDKFEQAHKPPTKAQQYVASGIPFAINPDSYSAEYFRRRGFEVASPADAKQWLSREYWEATRTYGEQLRAATSIEAVGARYRELIESI